jgi:hypothetical protein
MEHHEVTSGVGTTGRTPIALKIIRALFNVP